MKKQILFVLVLSEAVPVIVILFEVTTYTQSFSDYEREHGNRLRRSRLAPNQRWVFQFSISEYLSTSMHRPMVEVFFNED